MASGSANRWYLERSGGGAPESVRSHWILDASQLFGDSPQTALHLDVGARVGGGDAGGGLFALAGHELHLITSHVDGDVVEQGMCVLGCARELPEQFAGEGSRVT